MQLAPVALQRLPARHLLQDDYLFALSLGTADPSGGMNSPGRFVANSVDSVVDTRTASATIRVSIVPANSPTVLLTPLTPLVPPGGLLMLSSDIETAEALPDRPLVVQHSVDAFHAVF